MAWFLILLACLVEPVDPIVIAHRGASGYAVEHTEAAKTLAHAQGADFIEQDVVLSQDGEFVVTHDITMEETTNVEKRFPERARKDGRYYFADFSWIEIQQLTLHERTLRNSDQPALPGRFPSYAGQRPHHYSHSESFLRTRSSSQPIMATDQCGQLVALNVPAAMHVAAPLDAALPIPLQGP